jgi:hypothetical protein
MCRAGEWHHHIDMTLISIPFCNSICGMTSLDYTCALNPPLHHFNCTTAPLPHHCNCPALPTYSLPSITTGEVCEGDTIEVTRTAPWYSQASELCVSCVRCVYFALCALCVRCRAVCVICKCVLCVCGSVNVCACKYFVCHTCLQLGTPTSHQMHR